MTIQGALADLAKVFLAIYIACCAVGRPDIPFKIVSRIRNHALMRTTESWGCPSLFTRGGDCMTYNPENYK